MLHPSQQGENLNLRMMDAEMHQSSWKGNFTVPLELEWRKLATEEKAGKRERWQLWHKGKHSSENYQDKLHNLERTWL